MPEAIKDGNIPRNVFGNIELFHKNMLPSGATHLNYKGIGRIAKKLGMDYAIAVTGFDFHRGHSTPVLEGIVVADENADIIKSVNFILLSKLIVESVISKIA